MHPPAEDRDAGLHRLPQECGGRSEREPGCGVFCVSAKSGCGWIFYQQDWDSVFGLYRERVFGRVSWVSAGSWGLEKALRAGKSLDEGHGFSRAVVNVFRPNSHKIVIVRRSAQDDD